jgi:hypothetical protein
MIITDRELNRATLARQLLLRREPLGITDAIRRLVALQAQHAASPYLALWNRLTDFDAADLDAAFASYTVVKATLIRMTLHAVHAGDYPVFREAIEPTLRATPFKRFTVAAGVTFDAADELVAELLEFANRSRGGTEFKTWLEERLGTPPGPVASRLLQRYTPMWHAPTVAPWSFGQRPSYIAARSPSVPVSEDTAGESLQVVVRRYLEGFGPASVADVAQFALVQQARVKAALGADLEELEGPDGKTLYDVPGAPRPPANTPAPPRLMAMWDSILLAYADRSRVIPPYYRKLVIRSNGDVLPTLLIDGYVAGVWRPVEGAIEATAFHPLSDNAWVGLAAEARSLLAFLAGREPNVYRRYDYWWGKLPSAGARLLPGD